MTDRYKEKPKQNAGLARNPEGVPFHCPSCEYYDDGECGHPDPRIHGKTVDARNCCNFFKHDGMEVIVK